MRLGETWTWENSLTCHLLNYLHSKSLSSNHLYC
uniref:Uncharacterized protein n=1 Tax=Arundo donax TaxID=35708 RepID=A0A0A9FL18_ARUDO